jgi:N6-L-threonylcarbamoyladenine synthase
MPTILAIESSCDETSCAISREGVILSNIIAGQAIHEQYGGVVPELASRAHLQNIVPVVDAALQKAGLGSGKAGDDPGAAGGGPDGADARVRARAGLSAVDAIAFTQSPGLIGALLVGSQFAKSLALSLDIPLIAVHHMQAHVLANLIPRMVNGVAAPMPRFPFLCLTVSGGHTQIVRCESPLEMRVIGETLDDAAGEAFDKSAKLLGLPYPGGPLIDKYASQGDPARFTFPEPRIPELNFSFSGLKTAILYFLQDHTGKDPGFIEKNLPDICASIQSRIVSILLNKLTKAAQEEGITDLCIAGGVSANSGLRKALVELGTRRGWNTFIPPMEYCTDNAAMIAITGHYKYLAGQFAPMSVSASARAVW